ncbi:hypothetical protein C8Q75DRAFT_749328 [Abortiporus biennis]|nr:hypothetical protein C8Q75DRAFT_749328 [Abortiporus biennis]
MRKTSYVLTLFAVLITLTFNIVSLLRPDWLTVHTAMVGAKSDVFYGLMSRCEASQFRIPTGGSGDKDGGEITWRTAYKCRPFPSRSMDNCDNENKLFCVEWTTAGYLTELSAGFGVVACLAIIFGVTTHSRRRRIWRAVAALVALHASLQLAAFTLITDTYRYNKYPSFEYARPGLAYILNVLSWAFGILITFGVLVTGVAAHHGHRWAAGNRAYRPISQ